MKQTILSFFLLFYFPQFAFSQDAFQKLYKGLGASTGHTVIETSSGYIICGHTRASALGDRDALLIETDKEGNINWAKGYGGGQWDQFKMVAEANGGGYVAIGETKSTGNGQDDILFVKTDAQGNVVWARTFGGSLNDQAPFWGQIVVLPDGYIISGPQYTTQGNGGNVGSFFIRVDEDGDTVWSHNYDSSYGNILGANYVENDIIYASGGYEAEGCMAQFDLATGDLLQLNFYAGNGTEALYHMRPTQDGNLLVSDHSWSRLQDTLENWLIKMDKNGQILWSKTYHIPGYGSRGPANPTQDGGYLITSLVVQGTSEGAVLIKLNANGEVEWAGDFGKNNQPENLYSNSALMDGGGIATGRGVDNAGVQHTYLLKTAAPGSFGDCCERSLEVQVNDFVPNTGTGSLFNMPPFDGQNWASMQSVVLNLEKIDYCTPQIPPLPTFDVEPSICGNSVLGSIQINGAAGSTFSLSGGQFLPSTTYNLLAAGTYLVVEKFPNGCTREFMVEVPSISYDMVTDIDVATQPCTNLSAATAGTVIGVEPIQYNWDNTNWTTNNSNGPIGAGMHTLWVQDNNGCKDTLFFEILEVEPLQIENIFTQEIDCQHDTGSVSIAVVGGTPGYQYQLGALPTQSTGFFDIPVAGTYTLLVTDAEGCTVSGGPIVVAENKSTAKYETTVDICSSAPFMLPNGMLVDQTGVYTVQLTAANGCDSIYTANLTVYPEHLYIPNVFHPDDDGVNDYFTIYAAQTCVQNIRYLRVFDRWGSLVFERFNFPANEDQLGWDGVVRNRQAMTGVYIYDTVLELSNGKTQNFSGSITVVR